MSIVLNEYEWAEAAIESCDLGKKPYETLCRVAKYYLYCGMSKRDVRKKLDEFMQRCDKSISVVAWSDTLDSAVRFATRYPIVILDGICITDGELRKIGDLPGRQLRRLAFTLLCISKYYYMISKDTDHWVSYPDNEIMAMANINTSVRRQSAMYAQLRDAGMIRFSRKVDNLSVQVMFAEDGHTGLIVTDFRNLGYQYLKKIGEPYFVCQNCGITEKIGDIKHGSGRKYCKECAARIHTKQKVESVMRRRAVRES